MKKESIKIHLCNSAILHKSKLVQVVQENSFKCHKYISAISFVSSLFCYFSSWEIAWNFFYLGLQWFLRGWIVNDMNVILLFSYNFCYFAIIALWKWLISTFLKLLSQGFQSILVKLLNGFGKIYFKCHQCIFWFFFIIFLWKKGIRFS